MAAASGLFCPAGLNGPDSEARTQHLGEVLAHRYKPVQLPV
jgi:hypothetical protein